MASEEIRYKYSDLNDDSLPQSEGVDWPPLPLFFAELYKHRVLANLLYGGTTRRRRKCSPENQIAVMGQDLSPGNKKTRKHTPVTHKEPLLRSSMRRFSF